LGIEKNCCKMLVSIKLVSTERKPILEYIKNNGNNINLKQKVLLKAKIQNN